MKFGVLLVWVLSMFAVGCSGTQTREYGLEVKNNSTKPLTIGLVKVGHPLEDLWLSPEDHALLDPENKNPSWGITVLPGKTASVTKVAGEFLPDSAATVRIYVGQLELSQVLAVSRESRSRIEVPLKQGKTVLAVVDRGPFVDVAVVSYTPWGPDAGRTDQMTEKP